MSPAPDRGAGPPTVESLAGHGVSVPTGLDRIFALSRGQLRNGIAAVLALAIVGVTYWRLYYGIDFTDESFYVAVPYRFALGARPFADETNVTQTTAGLLLYPFVRAYDAVAGTTGIVLFVRHLQFVLSLLVGGAVFASVRRPAGTLVATLLALCCIAFVPFGIHSLSYDTLGSGLFTAGCFLGAYSLRRPENRRIRLTAGLAHGLAVFAYPPLAIPVTVCFAIRLVVARGHRRAETLVWGPAALGLPAAAMAALVRSAGFHQVISDYRRSSTYLGQAGGFDKMSQIVRHEWTTLRWPIPLLVAVFLLGVAWRWRRGAALPLLLAVPVLAAPTNLMSDTTSLEYVAHFGMLGLVLFWLVRRRTGAGLLFAAVWLPAVVAGIVTAYSSANGGVNFGVGFFPAAVVTTLFLVWTVEESLQRGRRPVRRLVPFAFAPAVGALAALVAFEIFPVYRDSALSALAARVESGPYAGLVTTRRKADFLDRLERDLSGIGPSCRIVFLKDFPAGYLLTGATPDTNAVWTQRVAMSQTASYQAALIDYFRQHGFPDVAVVMRRIPYAAGRSARFERDWSSEPIMVALRTHDYRVALARHAYTVYRAASSSC